MEKRQRERERLGERGRERVGGESERRRKRAFDRPVACIFTKIIGLVDWREKHIFKIYLNTLIMQNLFTV